MKDIYILGSLNTDLTVYLDHYPKKGETVKGRSFRTGAGGKGLNQAIAAAKLGAEVHFLGAIGNDSFGREMKDSLTAAGGDASHVIVTDKTSSGVAMIEVADGTNSIVLDLGANLTIAQEDVETFLEGARP